LILNKFFCLRSGIAGYVNGPVASAQFNGINQIAVDSQNNLFICDSNNQVIRVLYSSSLTVATLAGSSVAGYKDGKGSVAKFNSPSGILLSSSGSDIWIAEQGNNLIRHISCSG
jgi:hypothetical protein